MDRIEKLERAVRWQRAGLILLGLLSFIGAKGIKVGTFDIIKSKEVFSDQIFCIPVEKRGEGISMTASDETATFSLRSPNGKRLVHIAARDDWARLLITSGDRNLSFDEKLMDILNKLAGREPDGREK